MSAQTDLLRMLTRMFNERAEIDVERYFTPDFELDQAGAGASRSGLAGARDMVNALYALDPGIQLEILATIEEGDCVAVRWQVTSTESPDFRGAMLAMYRFVAGRIAEDWGVGARPAAWRR